jgi:1-acyl-sn-glycerol-3-phosphate acyltransferase
MGITFLAKQLRGPLKLAQLALQFGRGLWTVALRFPFWRPAQKNAAIQRWARQVLAILDIEVQAHNMAAPGFSGLVVSNHLSWLDVLVLQSLMPVAFVAKSEVRRWPVVGYLAHACATIFVDRNSARSAHAMVERTAAAITQGQAVVVFPEGTSSDGQQLGTFHPNIFESAIRADSQVQPLALQYVDAATGTVATAAHFTGDMTLLGSLQKVSTTAGMRAQVHVGPCIAAHGHSRKTLALQAHASIRIQLFGHLHAKA